MPRVSQEQAKRNRQRVVEVAATLFRERGLHGVGVADIMSAAGLTHGGFYGQFANKDALAVEAFDCALDEDRRGDSETLVTEYLSAAHVRSPEPAVPSPHSAMTWPGRRPTASCATGSHRAFGASRSSSATSYRGPLPSGGVSEPWLLCRPWSGLSFWRGQWTMRRSAESCWKRHRRRCGRGNRACEPTPAVVIPGVFYCSVY